jgi:hypothetical protein
VLVCSVDFAQAQSRDVAMKGYRDNCLDFTMQVKEEPGKLTISSKLGSGIPETITVKDGKGEKSYKTPTGRFTTSVDGRTLRHVNNDFGCRWEGSL